MNGSFKDGHWFCACDDPAVWRVVRKAGETQGQRFLRCTGEQQCSFFLWEVDEARARSRVTQRASPRPTTPPSTASLTNALYLPTPSTAGSSALPTRSRRLPAPDESPTPRLGRAAVTPSATDDEDDEDDKSPLFSQIVTRLRTDGFSLLPSTKEYLRHTIHEEVAVYEAKLQTRDNTIARLNSKLDQLTLNGHIKVET